MILAVASGRGEPARPAAGGKSVATNRPVEANHEHRRLSMRPGPVPSRRSGRSLGIDLVPFKPCTYDCVYCQLGPTTNLTLPRIGMRDGVAESCDGG